MNTGELPELMTRAEVRKALRISESTLQLHFDNKLLNRVRIGRRVFVRRDDVLKLLQPDVVAQAADDLCKVRTVATRRCRVRRGTSR